jgi:hypothetical protein
MKSICLTHCSREKALELERTGTAVTPDELYTSESLLRFIRFCKNNGLEWAIFSDRYGVVFPNEKISWYNKPPSEVTQEEFEELLKNFTTRLASYDEIHFYQRKGETHPLFERIVAQGRLSGLTISEFLEENIID